MYFYFNDLLNVIRKKLDDFIKENPDFTELKNVKVEGDENENVYFTHINPDSKEKHTFFCLELTGCVDDGEYQDYSTFTKAIENQSAPFDFEEEPLLFGKIMYFGLCSTLNDIFKFVHVTYQFYLKHKDDSYKDNIDFEEELYKEFIEFKKNSK